MTPYELDQRSLALHRLIIDKVRANPALLNQARDNIRRWETHISVHSMRYLKEWQRLMNQGPEICLAAAIEDSEKGQTLRSCTPFCGILTPRERNAFYKEWRDAHVSNSA